LFQDINLVLFTGNMEETFKNIYNENKNEFMDKVGDAVENIEKECSNIRYDRDGESLMTSTKHVNKKTFRMLKSLTGLDDSKVVKLKIMDIMPKCLCHVNCLFMKTKLVGSKVILGFNLTACECGCFYALELHSVIEYENKLYDITEDFNRETHKYFIRIAEMETFDNIHHFKNNLMEAYGFVDGYIYPKNEHRCMTTKKKLYYSPKLDFDEEENKTNIGSFFKDILS